MTETCKPRACKERSLWWVPTQKSMSPPYTSESHLAKNIKPCIIKSWERALFQTPHKYLHNAYAGKRLREGKVVIDPPQSMHVCTSTIIFKLLLIRIVQKWCSMSLQLRSMQYVCVCIWNRFLLSADGLVLHASNLESDDEVHKICKFIHFECKNLECSPTTMSIHVYYVRTYTCS